MQDNNNGLRDNLMQAEQNAAELDSTAVYIAQSIATLPPLPAAAQDIVTQFADEFIDADTVTAVVEKDPGICAKLLGLANSAYFNLAEPVSDMKEAISRVLGVDTVRSLVFAMAMQQSFDSKQCPSFDAERFWLDAISVADSCKRLAKADEQSSERERSLAYPAGLCHNLGLMALAHIKPDRTDKVLKAHADNPAEMPLYERFAKEFGTDHRFTTAELSKAWSLPQPIIDAYSDRVIGAPPNKDDRLSAVLKASIAAVGNQNGPADTRADIEDSAIRLGFSIDEFERITTPGDRQKERLRSIASTMKG